MRRALLILALCLVARPALADTAPERMAARPFHGGTRPTLHSRPGGNLVDGFSGAFTLMLAFEPIAFGLGRLGIGFGFSSIEGVIVTADIVPVFELSPFVDDRGQLIVQLGGVLSIQGETAIAPLRGGFAPYAAVGARVWWTPWFAVSVLAGASVLVTDEELGPRGSGELAFEVLFRP